MDDLSINEILICVLIAIAFVLFSFVSNRYTKRKFAEQGQMNKYRVSRAISLIISGLIFLVVTLYSSSSIPQENESLVMTMVVICLGMIGYGITQYLKSK